MYEQARAILAATAGEKHPDHARILIGLGALDKEGGEYARARAHYEQALERFMAQHKLPRKSVRLGVATNRIGVRVLGSWTAASALFVLALAVKR